MAAIRRAAKTTLSHFLAIAMCALVAACEVPESWFWLDMDSRIPVWFSVPSDARRSDLTVKFTFYGEHVEVRLARSGSLWTKAVDARNERGSFPVKLDLPSARNYEAFEVMSVGGVMEVFGFEKSAADPLLLKLEVIDDPVLKEAVLQTAAVQREEYLRNRRNQ